MLRSGTPDSIFDRCSTTETKVSSSTNHRCHNSMSIERWGSLSVADHTDTAALAVNVLLYDRLVLPVMTR
jgi:hypothetical protein